LLFKFIFPKKIQLKLVKVNCLSDSPVKIRLLSRWKNIIELIFGLPTPDDWPTNLIHWSKRVIKFILKLPENIIFGITIVFRMKSIFLYININE